MICASQIKQANIQSSPLSSWIAMMCVNHVSQAAMAWASSVQKLVVFQMD